MKLQSKSIIGALSLISLNAVANNSNQFNYVGFNIQNNSYDSLNFSPQIDTTQLSPLKYDDKTTETGFRGFVGHQFNRYLAVEAGVTSFGKASFTVTEEQVNSDGSIKHNTIQDGEFETLGIDIRIVGTYPINDSLFLKAQFGALGWDNDFSILASGSEGVITQKTSDTGVSLITGVSIAYGFNDSVAISFDFERTEISKITTESLGVSLMVRF